MKLGVSENRRYLVREDGSPFFYLGDTAWELFHRLTREEADHYLTRRAEQGFTVIQAVVLAELDGLDVPNAYGHRPLEENDPTRPVEAFMAHVDWVVGRANELGLTVALLPTWGDKWNRGEWGKGPEIFTPENARAYGAYLGRRYRDADLIWMLGGDRPYVSELHIEITRAMAEGIREGDGGAHLITVHPYGGAHSSERLHAEPWLDFNTIQSGHGWRNGENYRMIAQDYALLPKKPTMDAESAYEDHPVNWRPEELGYFTAVEVRRPSFWGVFAGGHGLTYGHHAVWQFLAQGRGEVGFARGNWRDALEFPVASQMVHLKRLMLSRPFLSRIPDRSLVVGDPGVGERHVQATRGDDGGYAFVYFPGPGAVDLDLSRMTGETLRASWYDPRTGEVVASEAFARTPHATFTPPSTDEAPDWVLVLDDEARGYGVPGR
ncbi:MAG: glycoside hydrolase family 140 protein [Fimbriimonas sp.]